MTQIYSSHSLDLSLGDQKKRKSLSFDQIRLYTPKVYAQTYHHPLYNLPPSHCLSIRQEFMRIYVESILFIEDICPWYTVQNIQNLKLSLHVVSDSMVYCLMYCTQKIVTRVWISSRPFVSKLRNFLVHIFSCF